MGKRVDPKVFSDDNAGRAMDRLFQYGTTQLFTKIALKAFEAFSPSSRFVHFDTTSVSVFGDYLHSEDSPRHLTYGHSKDKRPDLKQFIFSMFCVGGNVPIFGKAENGNASDKALNNQVLSAISNHMKLFQVDPGTFIYVADSAVVTPDNLDILNDEIRFITRLPATYGECDRVIHQAFEEDSFKEIGSLSLAKPTKSRPVAQYKLNDSEVTLYDKRRQKRLQKEVDQSLDKMKSLLKAYKKETWFCRKDAEQALEKLKKQQTAFHDLKLTITEVPIYQRGPLKKGSTRAIKETRYTLDAEIVIKDEHSVTHVVGEVALGPVHVLEEGEDLGLHMLEHLLGLHALELAPTQGALFNGVVVGPVLVTVFGRNPLAREFGGVGLAGPFGIGLLFLIQLVEPLHEQQIGDLLDSGERVGDSTGPELVPELVDLAFEFGVVL
jgi:transposase